MVITTFLFKIVNLLFIMPAFTGFDQYSLRIDSFD